MTNPIFALLWGAFKKAAWAPIAVFVIHTVSTQFFRAYFHLPSLDTIEHFVGGIAIAYFFYHLLESVRSTLFQPRYEIAMQNVIVFLATGTTTVLWEFTEYILDHTWVIHGLRQGSVGDTMLDMALGMAGGICYLVIRSRTYKLP